MFLALEDVWFLFYVSFRCSVHVIHIYSHEMDLYYRDISMDMRVNCAQFSYMPFWFCEVERGHIKWDESFNRQPYIYIHITCVYGFRMSCVSNDVSFTMRCRTQLRTIINPDFFVWSFIAMDCSGNNNVCRCQAVLPSQSYYSTQKILPERTFREINSFDCLWET